MLSILQEYENSLKLKDGALPSNTGNLLSSFTTCFRPDGEPRGGKMDSQETFNTSNTAVLAEKIAKHTEWA